MMSTEETLAALCRSKGATLERVVQLERTVEKLAAAIVILSVLAILQMLGR